MAEQQQLSIEQRIEQAITPPQEQPSADAPTTEQPTLLNTQSVPAEVAQQEPEKVAEAPVEASEATLEGELVEQEGEQPKSPEGEAEESESFQVESLNQLAEQVGVDASDLYNLKIPVTDQATGERMEVTLGEYKDSFTAKQRSTRAEEQAQQAKIDYENQKMKAAQEFEQSAQQNAQILNMVEQQLMTEFNNVPWDNLKTTDPQQWSIKRQEFTERQNAIQNIRQTAAQQYQQKLDAGKVEQQKQMQDLLQREQESLYRALPTFKDEETRNAEQVKLTNYLLTQGYSNDELQTVYDHRTLVLAHKAMQFDSMKEKGETAKKKVAKIGKKVLKPGAKQSKKQQTIDADAKLRARLKETGDHRDAAALISQKLKLRGNK